MDYLDNPLPASIAGEDQRAAKKVRISTGVHNTTAYGVMEAQIAGSAELCERVVKAAEQAGFEYLLIPVGSTCWEAWIAGAFMAVLNASWVMESGFFRLLSVVNPSAAA